MDGDGRVVAVDPDTWAGKRFPLLRHIDQGEKLARGNWIVMLHREDCAPCREALPQYVGLAYDLASSAVSVALVEIPPWKGELSHPAGSACLRTRLSDAHQWEIRTPLFLSLKGGVVEEVTSDPNRLLERSRGVVRQVAERSGPLSFPDYRQARRNRYLSEIACGPLSLLAVFRALGIDVSRETEERIIAEAGDRGIDMLRLKEVAEREGVYVLGVAMTSSDLARVGLPAVIHDGRFGFAAALGSNVDGVRVVPPFKPAVVLSSDEFTKLYGSSVAALLVSPQQIDAARLRVLPAVEAKVRGPWLRPERTVVSVGRVYKRAWEATLKLRNAGDAPLRIGRVKAGCPGVKASVDASWLRPEETATLRVSGSQEEPGSFTCAVEIETNEASRKSVKVPVRGYAEQAVWLEQSALVMDRALPNQEVRAEVKFGLEDGFSPDKVYVRVPDGVPFVGKLIKSQDGLALALTWRGAATVGWHRFTVQVEPKEAAGFLATPLPVAVHVVPAVEVFPESLWLRDAEVAGTWSRRLTVRLPRTKEVRVVIADEEIAKSFQVRVSRNGDGEYHVTLGPQSSGAVLPFQGKQVDLELKAGDETVKKISLSLGELQMSGRKEAASGAERPK